jgi:hypothetical protein
MFKRIALVVAAATLLAGVAYPQSSSAAVPNASKARFERQRDRIAHGVQNGSLTQHEYNRDIRRLDKLHAERRQMLKQNNGTLTKNDRQQLRNQLTRSSHQIYYTKHNANRQQPPK